LKAKIATFLSVVMLAAVFAGCTGEAPSINEVTPVPEDYYPADAESPGLPEGPDDPSLEEAPEPPRFVILPMPLDWEFGDPEDHGVDTEQLEAFLDVVAGRDIYSVVIVRNGVIISEFHAEGITEHTTFGITSCTKSIMGALIGIAIERGYISDVDATLGEFLPEVVDTDKQDITIRHLLGHSSGIRWREWGAGTMFRDLQDSENWLNFILEQPMEAAPGEHFNYSSGGSHLLSVVLQRSTDRTAVDFAFEHLFLPMGIMNVRWRSNEQGYTDGGSGIIMTSRDLARFGQLYLDGGVWDDTQIVPAWWVEESTQTQFAGAPGTGTHGFHWWITRFGGYDLFYAMGAWGQYIFVVPELNLVTVINSRTENTYEPQWIFRDYLIPAFE